LKQKINPTLKSLLVKSQKHQKTTKEEDTKMKSYSNKSNVLIASSVVTIVVLLSTLIALWLMLFYKDLTFSTDDGLPIMHCQKFRQNSIPGMLG
jgi:hypothetical protein